MRRRHFLAAAGAAGAALAGDTFAIEPRRVQLTRHDVPVPGLPPALEGLRIAQVSDMHLPACRGPVAVALELLARERPEIVLHTGDALETADAALLADLGPALCGTVASAAVLGNWEHRVAFTGRAAERAWGRAGVALLLNSHLIARVSGAELALVGLEDLLHARPDVVAARRGLSVGIPEIWLGHEPELTAYRPADVAPPAVFLSGHTHGGQIRIPGVRPFTPVGSGSYVAGWYHDRRGPLYVSRGIGTAEIRARFLCPPELPVFRLTRA
ncbi:MAG: metallophosphoesterase [Gemmatimonadales bacterium]